MALPGLFIEYLVIGALALLWVLPVSGIDLLGGGSAALKIAALAPAVYVLGMFVDFFAFLLVTWLPTRNGSYKDRVRRIVELKHDIAPEAPESDPSDAPSDERREWKRNLRIVLWDGFPEMGRKGIRSAGSTARRQIRLLADQPDVAKQVEMRSSRDRIARGSVFNLALIGLFNLAEHPWQAALCLILAVSGIPMWAFFEGNSYSYELRARSEIGRKEAEDERADPQ